MVLELSGFLHFPVDGATGYFFNFPSGWLIHVVVGWFVKVLLCILFLRLGAKVAASENPSPLAGIELRSGNSEARALPFPQSLAALTLELIVYN